MNFPPRVFLSDSCSQYFPFSFLPVWNSLSFTLCNRSVDVSYSLQLRLHCWYLIIVAVHTPALIKTIVLPHRDTHINCTIYRHDKNTAHQNLDLTGFYRGGGNTEVPTTESLHKLKLHACLFVFHSQTYSEEF